jgi:hypothetical protein
MHATCLGCVPKKRTIPQKPFAWQLLAGLMSAHQRPFAGTHFTCFTGTKDMRPAKTGYLVFAGLMSFVPPVFAGLMSFVPHVHSRLCRYEYGASSVHHVACIEEDHVAYGEDKRKKKYHTCFISDNLLLRSRLRRARILWLEDDVASSNDSLVAQWE